MQVTFWGTRGSIAKAGPSTLRFGGNTSCVEVRSDAGSIVVLDCGTGAHGLGEDIVARNGGEPMEGHLLIGHTHWDHIQGLPFFAPLFQPGSSWHIYGPRGLAGSLSEILAGQMQYAYFPVSIEQLTATVDYHDLIEGTFDIDDITVTSRYLNHPALTLG
ncbi:MAG: MBL fold metallo-hydrolase, partial [Acidimicrobiales bacterium]